MNVCTFCASGHPPFLPEASPEWHLSGLNATRRLAQGQDSIFHFRHPVLLGEQPPAKLNLSFVSLSPPKFQCWQKLCPSNTETGSQQKSNIEIWGKGVLFRRYHLQTSRPQLKLSFEGGGWVLIREVLKRPLLLVTMPLVSPWGERASSQRFYNEALRFCSLVASEQRQ